MNSCVFSRLKIGSVHSIIYQVISRFLPHLRGLVQGRLGLEPTAECQGRDCWYRNSDPAYESLSTPV